MNFIFKKLFPSAATRVLLAMYLASLLWWITIVARGIKYTPENHYFGIVQIILPIFAAVTAISRSSKIGSNRLIKIVVQLLSIGLFFWGIGSMIFVYYNIFLHVEAPYPSFADFAYFWPPILWIIALIYLTKLIGIEQQLRHMIGRIAFFIIPIAATAISFYLLFVVARGSSVDIAISPIKLFFDFSYPIFDIVILIVLSLIIFGLCFGKISAEFILPVSVISIAFIFQYFADFSFSYTTTKEIYFAGDFVDMLFTTSLFFIAWSAHLLARAKIDPQKPI